MLGRKTREEIHALYEGADIFFLPSVSEGIANVVLEAMSMELPVVSSNAGGMREAITDRVDGMICPVDDAAAMAEALHWLAKHYEIRKQMGIRARQKITENYSIIRYIDVFEHAYQQLLEYAYFVNMHIPYFHEYRCMHITMGLIMHIEYLHIADPCIFR